MGRRPGLLAFLARYGKHLLEMSAQEITAEWSKFGAERTWSAWALTTNPPSRQASAYAQGYSEGLREQAADKTA